MWLSQKETWNAVIESISIFMSIYAELTKETGLNTILFVVKEIRFLLQVRN